MSAGHAGPIVLREGWLPVRGETYPARRAAQQPGPAKQGHALPASHHDLQVTNQDAVNDPTIRLNALANRSELLRSTRL